jgi:hypothetical protein
MRYIIQTLYKSCTLRIDVVAKKQCQINVEVCDTKMANTYFMRRSRDFVPEEKQSFYVQMPLTGKAIFASIFEGDNRDSKPVSFEIKKVVLLPPTRQLDVVNWFDKNIRYFVPFAERFCFNAGVLPSYTDRNYTNKPKGIRGMFFTGPVFEIKYSTTIFDEGSGEPLTPARVAIDDRIIEVSKAKFVNMTVPMRLCILLHEFSHLWINKEMTNEEEADLNGLKIYLSKGYSPIEAHETFLSTFYSSQTEKNFARYEKINNYIDEYEALRIKST